MFGRQSFIISITRSIFPRHRLNQFGNSFRRNFISFQLQKTLFYMKFYAHVLFGIIFPTHFQWGSGMEAVGGLLFLNNYKASSSSK